MTADKQDLYFIKVEIVDKNGIVELDAKSKGLKTANLELPTQITAANNFLYK